MICQYIRRCQLKRIIYPAGLLLFCILLIWKLPLKNQLHPVSYSLTDSLEQLAEEGYSYISLTADTLYDTGCDYEKNDKIEGHYYYSLVNGTCQFFLLPVSSPGAGHQSTMNQVSLTGKIISGNEMYEKLVSQTASALGWTTEGVQNISSPYVITTLHYITSLDILLYVALALSILAGSIGLVIMVFYSIAPQKAGSLSRLRRYPGNHSLDIVEEEIQNRVLVHSGSFYVTEHYMASFSDPDVQILPLSSIVWIYRHSSFFKLFCHHFTPTYYLVFMDQFGKIYECSSRKKEDTTDVIRAIRKFHPEILIGYTQENKKEAKKRISQSE